VRFNNMTGEHRCPVEPPKRTAYSSGTFFPNVWSLRNLQHVRQGLPQSCPCLHVEPEAWYSTVVGRMAPARRWSPSRPLKPTKILMIVWTCCRQSSLPISVQYHLVS
jgi:hypothetical protein